jgi:hypothetical protein
MQRRDYGNEFYWAPQRVRSRRGVRTFAFVRAGKVILGVGTQLFQNLKEFSVKRSQSSLQITGLQSQPHATLSPASP